MLLVIHLPRNLFLYLQGRRCSAGFLTDMSHSIAKFSFIFWATYVIWPAIHLWIGRKDHWLGKVAKREQGGKSTFAIAGGIFAGMFIRYLLSENLPAGIGSVEIGWRGMTLAIFGLVFYLWAIRALGDPFTTIAIAQYEHETAAGGFVIPLTRSVPTMSARARIGL
jgi:hypothetical protein